MPINDLAGHFDPPRIRFYRINPEIHFGVEYRSDGTILTLEAAPPGYPGPPLWHPLQITTSGFAYDANGNATSIAAAPSNITMAYDIENRTGGSWFDQQNQPLDRAGTWNLYGLRGERLGTYSYSVNRQIYNMGSYLYIFRTATQTQISRNIYFGGRLIQSNGQTVVTDRLGSVRANEAGQTFTNPQDREKCKIDLTSIPVT